MPTLAVAESAEEGWPSCLYEWGAWTVTLLTCGEDNWHRRLEKSRKKVVKVKSPKIWKRLVVTRTYPTTTTVSKVQKSKRNFYHDFNSFKVYLILCIWSLSNRFRQSRYSWVSKHWDCFYRIWLLSEFLFKKKNMCVYVTISAGNGYGIFEYKQTGLAFIYKWIRFLKSEGILLGG